jgi:alcohol dehydrogenase
MARSLGAAEVICVDTNKNRLDRAVAFGATRVGLADETTRIVAEATERRGADVAMELSGSADACEMALANLGLGGRLVLVGAVFPTRAVPLAMEQVIRRHLTLTGVHNYSPRHLQCAVDFMTRERGYPFKTTVTNWVPLPEANRAFELARHPSSLRIGIRSED